MKMLLARQCSRTLPTPSPLPKTSQLALATFLDELCGHYGPDDDLSPRETDTPPAVQRRLWINLCPFPGPQLQKSPGSVSGTRATTQLPLNATSAQLPLVRSLFDSNFLEDDFLDLLVFADFGTGLFVELKDTAVFRDRVEPIHLEGLVLGRRFFVGRILPIVEA